ncbi:tRNA uridine 5-carboxymethylaminomethyl modification enzyme MnmG [Striga asiatica]|uniref:tRNA uridine 5-carboxymethylaminomethyl modification enzyme MnmG n=1 Tax=Striga asiatica TaxID=4170 RepID=A0A5A7QV66_STRAF|nr:tRNA uridine 5-carboxymethylaminomethyl modification enzyme MnmG [Striga asiatica]
MPAENRVFRLTCSAMSSSLVKGGRRTRLSGEQRVVEPEQLLRPKPKGRSSSAELVAGAATGLPDLGDPLVPPPLANSPEPLIGVAKAVTGVLFAMTSFGVGRFSNCGGGDETDGDGSVLAVGVRQAANGVVLRCLKWCASSRWRWCSSGRWYVVGDKRLTTDNG